MLELPRTFPRLPRDWDGLRILASDTFRKRVAQAAEGRYRRSGMQRGLPSRCATNISCGEEVSWWIADEIHYTIVSFRLLDLVGNSPALPLMDSVLLRNVMVFFETDKEPRVLSHVSPWFTPRRRVLVPGRRGDDAPAGRRVCPHPTRTCQLLSTAPAFARRQVGVTRVHAARRISQARIETSSLGPEQPTTSAPPAAAPPPDSLMATPRLAVSNSTIRALPNWLSSPSMASGTPSEYRNTRSPG